MRSFEGSMPSFLRKAYICGNFFLKLSIERASRYTFFPARICWYIALATMSLVESSSTNRSSSSVTSFAPAPRTASLISLTPSLPRYPVGWNCTNSKSLAGAPFMSASPMRRPVAKGEPAVYLKRPAKPPEATMVASNFKSSPSRKTP